MQNNEVSQLFEELADLLEIQGANAFRVRAYRNAARTISNLSDSVVDIIADPESKLVDIDGIGKDLAAKITTIVETHRLPQLEELREQIPEGVVAMLRIPGLGPKKVAVLFHELKLTTLDSLQAAAEAGEISEMKGFGSKTEKLILDGIAQLASLGQRTYFAEAYPQAEKIVLDLSQLPEVERASVGGSCRRCKETVGDLDVLVSAEDSEPVMDCLASHPLVAEVLARGDTKQRVRLHGGLELDLRVVPEKSYGAALQYFTGSKEHNIVIRRRAQERGLKVNEYGVFRGEEYVAGRTEEEVYATVDLPWIPPELRENRGEIERAENGQLPNLLELKQIRGDLHMHTTATDGKGTIEEMIEAARRKGYEYIAITDHSQRVSMAGGLDAESLRKHWREIRKVREKYDDIHVLCGIECDILENGEMDLDDKVLGEAEWVIAVLHYGLKQPREQIQKRLLNAIRHPAVCLIGHPTGRLIGKRPGADVGFDEIFQAAAEHGVMMEINAHPSRLDLNDVHAAAAHEHGIPIVIDTDAHSPQGLDVMRYGVYQARRAGLEKQDVANTRTWKQFQKLLKNG